MNEWAEALVHCRTGSLEIHRAGQTEQVSVHCRTGSLESENNRQRIKRFVHCRTGSLETDCFIAHAVRFRSLPHRQLRNHDEIETDAPSPFTAAQAA